MNRNALIIVANAVSDALGEEVVLEEVFTRNRKRKNVLTRNIYMYLYRNSGVYLSLHAIGAHLKRDHSTVIHACRVIQNDLDCGYTPVVNAVNAARNPFMKAISDDFQDAQMRQLTSEERAKFITIREREKARIKMQEAEGKIEKVMDLLRNANNLQSVQGWVLHKVNLILQQ